MIRLSWGQIIAVILPGSFLLVGVGASQPLVRDLITAPNDLSLGGIAFLLMLAALLGGALEALRRVLLDELLLTKCKLAAKLHSPRGQRRSVFYYLDSETMPIFTTAVEESYRYYTWHANLGLSITAVVIMRFISEKKLDCTDIVLLAVSALLLLASLVQYKYFLIFQSEFVRRREIQINSERRKS